MVCAGNRSTAAAAFKGASFTYSRATDPAKIGYHSPLTVNRKHPHDMNKIPRLVSLITLLFMLCATQYGCSDNAVGFTKSPSPPSTVRGDDVGYVIGPGDSLRIDVWRNPEVSTSVAVRPDGKISTPLIDDLQAVGQNAFCASCGNRGRAGRFYSNAGSHRNRRGFRRLL